MIKKLILSIIILFIGYILLIFSVPSVASAIEKILGLDGFNNSIVEFRDMFNEKSTEIPTTSEFLSGAVNIKDSVIDGVDTTKEKIDGIRETMSGVDDTYNNIKNGYNYVKDFIDTNSGKIDDAKEVIQNISDIKEVITNNGDTNQ